jgi:hypothetical protein
VSFQLDENNIAASLGGNVGRSCRYGGDMSLVKPVKLKWTAATEVLTAKSNVGWSG